jgi:hypothetical protein
MQFGQSACMFRISYGLQWRQGLRYIAAPDTKETELMILQAFLAFNYSSFVGSG